MQHLPQSLVRGVLVGLGSCLAFGACLTSVRPIYNDTEKTKAENAVTQFHRLYNEGKFQEIHTLLDDEAVKAGSDQFVGAARQTFEQWGRVQKANLSEAKVFPGSPIQVRMIYNVDFEKGKAQEWFIWNIRGNDARLFLYRNAAGFDTSQK